MSLVHKVWESLSRGPKANQPAGMFSSGKMNPISTPYGSPEQVLLQAGWSLFATGSAGYACAALFGMTTAWVSIASSPWVVLRGGIALQGGIKAWQSLCGLNTTLDSQ